VHNPTKLVLISAAITDVGALRCYVRALLIDAVTCVDFVMYSMDAHGLPRIDESRIPAQEIRAMLLRLEVQEMAAELLALVKAAEAIAAEIHGAIDMRERVALRRRRLAPV
jgi:hypothetical protein